MAPDLQRPVLRLARTRDEGSHWLAAAAGIGSRAVMGGDRTALYVRNWDANAITRKHSYFEKLEKRLRDIEDKLDQVQENQTLSPTGGTASSAHRKEERGSNLERTIRSINPGASRDPPEEDFGDLDTTEDPIDGMGAIKFTEEEDWGYFGPSSNIAFLRYISVALARTESWSQDPLSLPPAAPSDEIASGVNVSRPHHAEDDAARRQQSRVYGKVNMHALPSEDRAWTLIKEYFQKTGQLLPFVHEESFCATFLEMKRSNFTKARRTWLGLLNIIFAMATTLCVETDMSTEKRIEESDVFYQRANELCDKESKRNISLELVQYLLILGQYLQGTQKSVQAWTVHGLAITTAFQLGLHSPKSNKRFPPLENEIRKRVWLGCILLDRSLSMTFGRPAMIPESYCKLDLPAATFQIVGNSTSSSKEPRGDATFYTATVTLYDVMYRIIDSCYGQNLGLDETRSDSDLLTVILKGEEQLHAWKSSLASLQMSLYTEPIGKDTLQNMKSSNKILHRFTIVLSVRYHNLNILLHRPSLEKFLDVCGRGASNNEHASQCMIQHFGIASIEKCVLSAMTVISIVRTVVLAEGWQRDLLGAWNYSLFYTFNAALVIFAAMLVARHDHHHNADRVSLWKFIEGALPYFEMAVEALQSLDRGNRVVDRCIGYLCQLPIARVTS
ncbi:transcriptional regulatory protein GAL4, partial [Penicillium chermesinum]